MTNEQMIADIDRMTDPPYPADYAARCRAIGEKLMAAVNRHGINPGAATDERLRDLANEEAFVWSAANMVINAGVPVLEVWAIVKSTLEGKP